MARDPREPGKATAGRGLAWSSDPAPAPAPAPATPAAKPTPGPARARVHVRLERQGRGGKVVSVVRGLTGHPAAIEDLARAMKAACGAGGTVRGKDVEVQGDHRDRLVALLVARGFDARKG